MHEAAQSADPLPPGTDATGRVDPTRVARGAARPSVFGLAGFSGAGKTTLIERLIPRLGRDGWRVGVLKHTHHAFETDTPGKDSWRHREAGACEVMLASARRSVLTRELREAPEPRLEGLLQQFSSSDLVIVEGFKHAPIAKMEIHRASNGKPMLHPHDSHIVAIASDVPIATSLPWFDLDDIDGIAAFIENYLGIGRDAADAVR